MNCPKCGSTGIWLENDGVCDWIRCRCGLMKLVRIEKEGVVIIHKTPADQVALPKRDSQLHQVLMFVASFGDIQTDEVEVFMGVTFKNVSTNLKMLNMSGLLDIVEGKKGQAGGSIWRLSAIAEKLLSIGHVY